MKHRLLQLHRFKEIKQPAPVVKETPKVAEPAVCKTVPAKTPVPQKQGAAGNKTCKSACGKTVVRLRNRLAKPQPVITDQQLPLI